MNTVMVGFCNGLGIVIGVAQFNIFKVSNLGGDVHDDGHRSLNELGAAFAPFTNGQPWVDAEMGGWMAFHIIITILTYLLFPKLTKAIPGSLAGIIASTVLEWALIRPLGFKTNTVSDLASVKGSFPNIVSTVLVFTCLFIRHSFDELSLIFSFYPIYCFSRLQNRFFWIICMVTKT